MKFGTRILYGLVALVFLVSAVVQFHHHHDDGSVCILLHSKVCEHKTLCNERGIMETTQQLSETHHHCLDTECSLHLSDTEISTSNQNNNSDNIVAMHNHSVLCAMFCTALSLITIEDNHKLWPILGKIGNVSTGKAHICGLRAPPVL